jgi:hypothetical protein
MRSGTGVAAQATEGNPYTEGTHTSLRPPPRLMRPLGRPPTNAELKYALRKTKGCLACGFDPKARGVWDWWKTLSDDDRRAMWDMRPDEKVEHTFTDADIVDLEDCCEDRQFDNKPVYGRRH